MRLRVWIGLSGICLMTTGCFMSDDCKEQVCWNASITPTSCGVKIVNHCQAACDACRFNERPCRICMECATSEGGWPPSGCSMPQYSHNTCRKTI